MSNNNSAVSSASTKTNKTNNNEPNKITLKAHVIRNTTSRGEKAHGLSHYQLVSFGNDVLDLCNDINLRDYTGEWKPNTRTPVHKGIERTLKDAPHLMPQRNSGMRVTCSEIEVNSEKGEVILSDAGIANGAQTQGELNKFYQEIKAEAGETPSVEVQVEICVNPDRAERDEIAITSNYTNPVKAVSKAGKRGQLVDLDKSMRDNNFAGIQMRESDPHKPQNEPLIDSVLLLQLARLFTPHDILYPDRKIPNGADAKAYRSANACLKEFTSWWEEKDNDPAAKRKYEATLKLAPIAYEQYLRFNQHPGWIGTGIQDVYETSGKRLCTKNKSKSKVLDVANGMLFPVLSGLKYFVEEKNGEFKYNPPSSSDIFDEQQILIDAIKGFGDYGYDPAFFGRSVNAYALCSKYPEITARVMKATNITS